MLNQCTFTCIYSVYINIKPHLKLFLFHPFIKINFSSLNFRWSRLIHKNSENYILEYFLLYIIRYLQLLYCINVHVFYPSSYHFLVYNASLLTWLICRLYNYPGVRHLFAKPLQTVVKALDECKEQDYEWRLRLLM